MITQPTSSKDTRQPHNEYIHQPRHLLRMAAGMCRTAGRIENAPYFICRNAVTIVVGSQRSAKTPSEIKLL